jgi:hypothetical protein
MIESEILSSMQTNLDSELKRAINLSFKDAVASYSSGLKLSSTRDAFSRDIESAVIPCCEGLVQRFERLIADKMHLLHAESTKMVEASVDISAKLRTLRSTVDQLERSAQLAQLSSPHVIEDVNPYVDIERKVEAKDWDAAWRRAVEVYNGVDFMLHLMGNKSPEDFFASNPITDPLLALQVCINASKEIVQSQKSFGLKLDIISELVLGLTNPNRLNLSHLFVQLRDVLQQLATTTQTPRVREIQKIVVATERLITPPVSMESTPLPPVHRYIAGTPPPIYS